MRAVGSQTYQARLGHHSTQASPQARLLTLLLLHLPQVVSTHQGHTLWVTLCLRHPHLQLEVLLSFTEGQLLWGGCGTRCWRLEGEQALRLGWCFSWGTHLGHPLYSAYSSSRAPLHIPGKHCSQEDARWAQLQRPYTPASHWLAVHQGRAAGEIPRSEARQLSQCSLCPDPPPYPPTASDPHPHPALEGTLPPSPTVEQETHRTGTTSAPGGWGIPWPGLSQWKDHPRFCLQR